MSVKLNCKKCGQKFWDNVTLEKDSNCLCPPCDPDWNKQDDGEEEVENEVVDL